MGVKPTELQPLSRHAVRNAAKYATLLTFTAFLSIGLTPLSSHADKVALAENSDILSAPIEMQEVVSDEGSQSPAATDFIENIVDAELENNDDETTYEESDTAPSEDRSGDESLDDPPEADDDNEETIPPDLVSQPAPLRSGWNLIDGTWYYADSSGKPQVGWLYLNKIWYFLDPSQNGAMLTGSYRVGNTLYHSRPSGDLVTGNGWVWADGAWYYVQPSGALDIGWKKLGQTWYYLSPETGFMAQGFLSVGNKTYYLDRSGAMVANCWIGSTKDGWCWAQADGSLVSGWKYLSQRWYYFDPATLEHRAKTGLYEVGEHKCFSDADGALLTNCWIDINDNERRFSNSQGYLVSRQIKNSTGKYSFVDEEGVILSGWLFLGGQYFYAQPDTGEPATGWLKLDGNWYYLDAAGAAQTGWVKSNNKWYYLDPKSCVMQTGWLYKDARWYYLDPKSGVMQTGWIQDDGEWYHLKASGEMTANSSVKISDGTYWYMNASGRHDRQAGIDRIMKTAHSLLGVPYVWLGVYPKDGGMDCASFTWYLYKQIGIDIGFETYDQMHSGVRVSGTPQAGDIILMYYGSWPNYNPSLPEHVVLYAGNGMIYEEPDFGLRCQYVPLSAKGAWNPTVRRILS